MSARPLLALGVVCVAAVSACASAGHRAEPAPARAGTQQVTVGVPAGLGAAPFNDQRKVTIPTGWRMSVFARVQDPRLAVWTPDHRLLVSRPDHGDIVRLTPRGSSAPAKSILVSGLNQPHGLAFRGSTLYVAETNGIVKFTYGSGGVKNRQQLVSGLPSGGHSLKSVVVRPDGRVYFSIGSSGNISAEDRSASPQRATIMKYESGKVTVVARGVRNGTGLALDPDGNLWTAVNNRDRILNPDTGTEQQAYVNEHPMEELAKLYGGRDLGWPYCNPDASGSNFAKPPFARDYEMNRDGTKLDCTKLTRIEQGFPAHSAPLGMSFATLPTYGTGALVGTHGSWNRTPPRAPTVTFFHYYKGRVGAGQLLVTGFQNSDGNRWGRPVAAVRSPSSTSVYITDDQAGAIYRLTPG